MLVRQQPTAVVCFGDHSFILALRHLGHVGIQRVGGQVAARPNLLKFQRRKWPKWPKWHFELRKIDMDRDKMCGEIHWPRPTVLVPIPRAPKKGYRMIHVGQNGLIGDFGTGGGKSQGLAQWSTISVSRYHTSPWYHWNWPNSNHSIHNRPCPVPTDRRTIGTHKCHELPY